MTERKEGSEMNCPFCLNVMETGKIQSPQEISWQKGLKRPMLKRAAFHRGSIVLSRLSFMRGSAVKAFLCSSCRKVIIDYADKESDLNR